MHLIVCRSFLYFGRTDSLKDPSFLEEVSNTADRLPLAAPVSLEGAPGNTQKYSYTGHNSWERSEPQLALSLSPQGHIWGALSLPDTGLLGWKSGQDPHGWGSLYNLN